MTATGVPSNRINLDPPVGSKGLPLTWSFLDEYDDTPSTSASGSRLALFDESLWVERSRGTGTNINPIGGVPAVDQESGPLTLSPLSDRAFGPVARGLNLTLSPSSLNHEMGHIEKGAIIQDRSRSYHSASEIRSSVPFTNITISEAGRYTSHPTRRYTSGRPANHTWEQQHGSQRIGIGADIGVGTMKAIGTADSSDDAYTGGSRIEGIVHWASADLPSNGFGREWGDSHNSSYLTTLVSSPLISGTTVSAVSMPEEAAAIAGDTDLFTRSTHWCLNLGVRQKVLASGVSLSAPDGIPTTTVLTANMAASQDAIGESRAGNDIYAAGQDIGEDKRSSNLLVPDETIQRIMVSDKASMPAYPSSTQGLATVGPVDLGNHVVADSAGLIGYEGVFTASAFFSITKDSDPSSVAGTQTITDGCTYAGLNIQVHSGPALRRNGHTAAEDTTGVHKPVFRYASTATFVDEMTDGLKTAGKRTPNASEGRLYDETDANMTQFCTRLRRPCATRLGDGLPSLEPDPQALLGEDAVRSFSILNSDVKSNTSSVADRIIGSTVQSGQTANKASFTTGFLKDQIPTKVKVVPSVIGYDTVQVGSSTFRKPIVDYHVLVSAINTADIPDRKTNTDPANTRIGTPTSRNNPMPNHLHIDADYSDIPCTIYHAIFRLNPTLDEIVRDQSNALDSNLDGSAAECLNSVIPVHNDMTTRAAMGWGLHQIAPFRPIQNESWPKVPKMCAAVEGGGFYQRGGISHLWDADAYNGELFVGADIVDATDIAVQTTGSDGQPEFGVFGRGQITTDGNADPTMPEGTELMIFRYDPRTDPYHPGPKQTTRTDNPLRSAIGAGIIEADNAFNTATMESITITDNTYLQSGNWEIHDWVIPQIELMRYLGREEKESRIHPKSSQASTPANPIYHPTIHCSSLRVMEDGRMMMAAAHIDYIKTENDYPSAEIRYPLNPDLDVGGCPPGYYQSGGSCIPIGSEMGDLPVGSTTDPQSGETIPGESSPTPVNGSGTSTPNTDTFSLWPSWSKMKANTQARSLLMMFTNAKANPQGLVARGRADFGIRWERVAIDSAGSTELVAKQTWTHEDTWWSGARIAYWYPESGQRAIPLTYGSYPDCRMSHAHLPKSLHRPMKWGYPLRQPATTWADDPFIIDRPTDTWYADRRTHLTTLRYVATTYGLADFAAGANPHQELGWSGWSFPASLYDPVSYGDNRAFFSDAPESEVFNPGVQITPTEQGKWKGWGDKENDITGSLTEPLDPTHTSVHQIDLSGVSFPATFSSAKIGKAMGGPTPEALIASPITVGSIAEVVATLLDPGRSSYATLDVEYGNQGLTIPFDVHPSIPTTVVRTFIKDPTGVGYVPSPLENPSDPAEVITWESLTLNGTVIPFTTVDGVSGKRLMRGPMGGWSHHGPLHYGISKSMHPYRVDRIFKQVHGGVGYDLPLHLLIPPAVHVRARAGGRNSIELEMEVPFHRTDTIHLEGAATQNAGFDLGGQSPPGSTRAVGGQYYLRTNLWDQGRQGFANSKTGGSLASDLIHGPLVSGTSLGYFWSDHPTDHFHAGAIPIMPGTDYDLAMIEANRYSPLMLGRIDEMHDLDALAVSEQLLSSVDAHVSQTTRPYWDSGSIASAQGIGEQDSVASRYRLKENNACNPDGPSSPAYAGMPNEAMGHGQRILRTPDGTTHIFHLRRSTQSGSQNLPIWTHLKKPLHSDLFFNRRSLKPTPDQSVYDGKDECGPKLIDIGAFIGATDANDVGYVGGSAFASDSNGTIHAVIQYHANPLDATSARAHRLYYTKAERYVVATSPELVYDWDWSVHTPVLIQSGLSDMVGKDHGHRFDLRRPSLVCDSQDRLHLVAVQVYGNAFYDYGGPTQQNIVYSMKLPEEASFPDFAPAAEGPETAFKSDVRWTSVNNIITDAGQTSLNDAAGPNHRMVFCDYPKIALRSDDVPVVFWLGYPYQSFATADRRYWAVYTNIGKTPTGTNDPTGRFVFDINSATHVVGLPPDSRNTQQNYDVVEYDAIVDERDRAVVVALKDDRRTDGSPAKTYANRQTLMTVFDTRKTTAEQYNSTNGLGDTRTLLIAPTYNGTTETRAIDPRYTSPCITTNGKGQYHIVIGYSIEGQFNKSASGFEPELFGATFRDATLTKQSAIAPLQWPATPSADLTGVSETPRAGGFKEPVGWPGYSKILTPPYPHYADGASLMRHLMHIWLPSIEFDDDATAPDRVIRSMNIRMLSVPSLRYDATAASWVPIGSAQTLAGEEDFPHFSPQMRYQRFWGYDASELDMRWFTNELSWYSTPHAGSTLYFPNSGGIQMEIPTEPPTGEGVPGYPNGV
jgi:hypothetical protein